jgi:serine/threonine protein kinase
MREARLAARLEHRHAVTVYDVVEHEGQPCLVMELVPSQPLSEILHELGTLHEEEVATLGAQVASALAAAHAAGVVHRDVKPANILVADDGTARISDFGIAHAFGDTTLTSTGMLTGTPAYLAPEVARGGESGFASDVFSLGSTLYAALEGRPPFGEGPNPIGLLHRVASGQVEAPRHAGPLTPLLTRMLSPDPGARPTMAEVAEELDRFAAEPEGPLLAGHGVVPADEPEAPQPAAGADRPAGPPLTHSPSRRRRRWVLGLVALLVVVALVAAGMVLLRPRGGEDPITPPVAQPTSAGTTPSSAATTAPPTTAPPTTSPPATAPPATPAPSTAVATPPPAPPATASTPTASAPPTVSGTPSAAQLAGAISRYYSLVPTNLDAAWPLMTTDYQTRVAGGRQAYERFWNGFTKVTATEVAGSAPSTSTALITYTTKDGTVIRERTTFGLVNEGGVLKISQSTVTSRSG